MADNCFSTRYVVFEENCAKYRKEETWKKILKESITIKKKALENILWNAENARNYP